MLSPLKAEKQLGARGNGAPGAVMAKKRLYSREGHSTPEVHTLDYRWAMLFSIIHV